MAKMGRPKIEIPKDEFEKLCAIWCTLNDIAGWFDCSPDTIERWCKRTYGETFADTYKKKSMKGKISIRRKQFELAQKGNVGLLIWLDKNHMGGRDYFPEPPKPAVVANVDGKATITIRWTDESDPGTPAPDSSSAAG